MMSFLQAGVKIKTESTLNIGNRSAIPAAVIVSVASMVAVLAFLVTLAGCSAGGQTDNAGNITYTIRLTTLSGIQAFSGTMMVTRADGQIETTSVEGLAPRNYTVKGIQVDVTFSKESTMGYLKVEILNGRTLLAEGDTSAAFGTIWVTAR